MTKPRANFSSQYSVHVETEDTDGERVQVMGGRDDVDPSVTLPGELGGFGPGIRPALCHEIDALAGGLGGEEDVHGSDSIRCEAT